MNKTIRIILIAFGALFITVAVLVLRPVPIVSEDDALIEKGIVWSIYGSGGNDISFQLKNDTRRFYINRGLEKGLEINDLRDKLIGEQITLKYPRYWTPLDWNNEIKHISKLVHNNEIFFNELKE